MGKLCWRCGWKTYEWLGFRKLWADKARCFYCRIDALDKKYGPSETAELNKRKDGTYLQAPLTKWEIKWRRLKRTN